MPALTPNDAAFLDYAHKTRVFLKEQPMRVFGVRDLDSAIECTRNALFWCLSNFDEEEKCQWACQVIIALDILKTIRFLPTDQYPQCGLTTTVSLQERLPFTEFTKKEFGVAIKVISVLECVPDQFSNFTWSKMRQDMFERIYQKIKDLDAGVVG